MRLQSLIPESLVIFGSAAIVTLLKVDMAGAIMHQNANGGMTINRSKFGRQNGNLSLNCRVSWH